MKYILFIMLLFAASAHLQASQAKRVETIISLKNENGDIASVIFGLDSTATKGLDASLGEFAIPGFPPSPSGLQAFLTFEDSGSGVLSYKDYRPFRSTSSFNDTFQLVMTPSTDASRGSKIVFLWAYPTDPNIDSIIISDQLGGVIKRFKLDKREADTIKGNEQNLESYRIIVFYNIKVVSVDDEGTSLAQCETSIVCRDGFAHLSNELLAEMSGTNAQLFNQGGQLIRTIEVKKQLDLQSLPSGVYFLQCNGANTATKTLRLLKE